MNAMCPAYVGSLHGLGVRHCIHWVFHDGPHVYGKEQGR